MLRPIRNKVCVVCGKPYTTQSPTQLRCWDCIEHMLKRCARCGGVFVGTNKDSAARMRIKYCGACRIEVMRENLRNRMIPQSDDARARNRALRVRTLKESDEKRSASYKTSPKTATGSIEHSRAKEWHLISPNGSIIHVNNLSEFIRQNPSEFPSFESAIQSFYRISKTMLEPEKIKKHTYFFRGWSLECPSNFPNEFVERWNVNKLRKEIIETRRREKRIKDK